MWIKRSLILAILITMVFCSGCTEPQTSIEWNKEGNNLYEKGEYYEALDSFDKAIELDPQNNEVWNRKADTLFCLERYEEAINAYDEAIEIDPYDAVAWDGKVNSLILLDKYEEAIFAEEKVIASYDKAIEINPKDAVAWNNKGYALINMGNLMTMYVDNEVIEGDNEIYEEAIKAFDKAIELDPHDADSWSGKYAALDSLGRYDEANICCDKSYELRCWWKLEYWLK